VRRAGRWCAYGFLAVTLLAYGFGPTTILTVPGCGAGNTSAPPRYPPTLPSVFVQRVHWRVCFAVTETFEVFLGVRAHRYCYPGWLASRCHV
jgi:hypothetical protein